MRSGFRFRVKQSLQYGGILAVSVLACLLFLLIVEGVLRIGGVGNDTGLFVENPFSLQEDTYIVNKHFYAQFFPTDNQDWILNSLEWGAEITAEKRPDTIRIIIVGGSVALGHQAGPFRNSRILALMLERAYPSLEFEIYNLAAGALNSNVMRRVVAQAMRFQPDFVLVHMGNNEYIGPYGPAWSPEGIPPPANLIQARILLQRLRLTQLLTPKASAEELLISGGADGVFLHSNKVAYNAPGRLRMYDNFRANLLAICRDASDGGAVTILSTLGNNLRNWPPYVSAHTPDLSTEEQERWNAYYQAGIEMQEMAEGYNEALLRNALEKFLRAREIDETHASLQFRIGTCYDRLQEYAQAREAFTLARDYDCHILRADSVINAIIRECAAGDNEIILADVEDRFMKASQNEILGGDLYYDHVHLHLLGEYLIASSMFEAITQAREGRFPYQIGDAAAAQMSFDETMNTLGLSSYCEAIFLSGALETLETIQRYNEDLVSDYISKRLDAAKAKLDVNSLEQCIEVLRKTDLYKSGDVAVSRLIVELLKDAGRVDLTKNLEVRCPPFYAEIIQESGLGYDAKSEVARLLELHPTRPDVHRLASIVLGGKQS